MASSSDPAAGAAAIRLSANAMTARTITDGGGLLRLGGLLRRPAVRLGAGAAHQHRALTGAQAIGLAEGLDGLFVVDDGEGASPVGPPQAAFETPRVEHAGERIPDVREGIGLPR